VHISSLVSRSTGIAIEDGGAPVGGPQLHQLDHMLRHGPVGVLRPAAPSAERYACRCSDDSVLKVTPSGVSSEPGGTDGPRNRDGFGHRSKPII
jgi:hypothetical protein